ncbi:MAG: polysaccharide deacetylase family protein [Muribaculaceae bacterium]|nr:polysaccharide deacetylase family protein [Muribaculaceae bacterium]
MFIETPILPYRLHCPEAVWQFPCREGEKTVYLTFDDGPIPEVTPHVLDILDTYRIKATFFMVGDNVRRNPALLSRILEAGHSVGHHTMNHLQGMRTGTFTYLRNALAAAQLTGSTLFRPPHGFIRRRQARALSRRFTIVMHSVVTRDYNSSLSPEHIFDNVKRYCHPGAIIVFHDSLRAWPRLETALPRIIEWLISEGYEFRTIHSKNER